MDNTTPEIRKKQVELLMGLDARLGNVYHRCGDCIFGSCICNDGVPYFCHAKEEYIKDSLIARKYSCYKCFSSIEIMKKEDLIQFCRYYKGEERNPYEDGYNAAFWDYEKAWIEHNFIDSGRNILADYVDDFSRAGLALFEMADDTPVSLKALLFNRFCHWRSASMIECVEPFKIFYKKEYHK